MNIVLVSQCSKRALTETRRILDQFAERCGDRTWNTAITQTGLVTLRQLLRKTARKNTAVACHWIRGKNHSELLWIVGDAEQFNETGATPTNITRQDVLRSSDENNWHQLQMIRAITALAALLHDIGKATQAFQERLAIAVDASPGKENQTGKNHYRHEWVSVRLFQAFVGNNQSDDGEWLQRLADGESFADINTWEDLWLSEGRLIRDGLDNTEKSSDVNNPFKVLPPLAQAVAWLVLTHHRLPALPVRIDQCSSGDEDGDHERKQYKFYGAKPAYLNEDQLEHLLKSINADWNEPREPIGLTAIRTYWRFPKGLPVTHLQWRKKAAREARKLLQMGSHVSSGMLSDPFQMHLSRLCLMLADHHYSRLNSIQKSGLLIPVPERQDFLQQDSLLYANTTNHLGKTQFNQTLEEHLLGVQAHASLIAHSLPELVRSLPHLKNHKGLKQRSKSERFRWQDKAADLAAGFQLKSAENGAFIVNMASTGCGKTLGNARIMHALADPAKGMRCAFAMGLRTLTLQTGRSFQDDLALDDEKLAILVGGKSSKELFEFHEAQAEKNGSASCQALLDEGGDILYEGDDRHPLLQRLSDEKKVRSMLAAPVLVCTIDHLVPVTESLRGGRQIAPMLRLMSSDLVLDEPDDFDLSDLPALTRLVHWAGLLGSRVLLSSATLPPALINGLFQAYLDGRKHFQRHRGSRPGEEPNVCCMWVDEFRQVGKDCNESGIFKEQHADFVAKRSKRLEEDKVRRIAELLSVASLGKVQGENAKKMRRELFAEMVRDAAWRLHQISQNHVVDPDSGKRISFGLIRMANIAPLYDVALAMFQQGAPEGVRIHLCVYHSQFPLYMRSNIENRLDTCLNRRAKAEKQDPVLQHQDIRRRIAAYSEQDHLFIVLGSPVTEVGRDHDYDWAVVEPSSVRSVIQLAGRIRRHRSEEVHAPNIFILDHNIRHFDNPPGGMKAAYCKPGFEGDKVAGAKGHYLKDHDMHTLVSTLLDDKRQWRIDARPRIAAVKNEQGKYSPLVYLEHQRMAELMLKPPPSEEEKINARSNWAAERIWLTGILPQYQRFRDDDRKETDVVLLPDDEEENLDLYQVASQGKVQKLYAKNNGKLDKVPDKAVSGKGIVPWGGEDALDMLKELAAEMDIRLDECAKKYATASLPESNTGWRFHPVLGFDAK